MATDVIVGPRRTGFLDLSAEIRIDIYRRAFKSTKPIDCRMILFPTYTGTTSNEIPGRLVSGDVLPRFEPPRLAQLSSQFLRSCKTVHAEARSILFEVNTFELEHCRDLGMLKKLAGKCLPRIQALFYRCLLFTINKTRVRELKSLHGLRAVTLSYRVSFDLSPTDQVGSMTRSCQWHIYLEPYLGELMRIRPDIQFDVVSIGYSRKIVSNDWRPHTEESGLT